MSWKKLYIGDIQIKGIHQNLLSHQGKGLSKHIGNYFLDLSDHSAWLGGSGEAWERGPYYVDGLIPLAYLLQDEELKKEANKWVQHILDSQDESGFFGPTKNKDWWPRAVVLKALVSYYLATKEERVLLFVKQYITYQLNNIEDMPFDFWGYSRGMEGIEIIDHLDDLFDSEELDQYLSVLKDNTIDWTTYFRQFPYPEKTDQYMPKYLFRLVKLITNLLDERAKKKGISHSKTKEKILQSRDSKNNLVFLKTHGVNIAMALKYLVYWGEESDVLLQQLDNILSHHGNATGIFSSDEHLNGNSPYAGIELCNVVEMMYSMEEIIRLTGNIEACNRLEYYAYNALLTTITPDFTSHQYVQQVNQLDCEVRPHPFYDSYRFANTFGIEPNYGCCAANMHQGWPKMMLSVMMKQEDVLGIFLYVSGEYTIPFPDGTIHLEVKTNYPFSDTVSLTCISSTSSAKWQLRIPYKANTTLHKEKETIAISNQEVIIMDGLHTGESIQLTFDFQVETIQNTDQTYSIKKGPLLFAQHLPYEEFYIKGTVPFHDRGFKPLKSPNVSLVLDKNKQAIVVEQKNRINESEFYQNGVSILVKTFNHKTKQHLETELNPYGLSVLRRTHFDGVEE